MVKRYVQHAEIGGLGADDHPHYHNDARGDARYRARSAASFGIDPANTAADNRAALIALSNTSHRVVFGPGDYPVDNAAGAATITNFSGAIIFDPAARLVFTDSSKGGIAFDGGTLARLIGIRTAYQTQPTVRVNNEFALQVKNATSPIIEYPETIGSPSIGLAVSHCTRPRIRGTRVANTMADGAHINNCVDAQVFGHHSEDTGDDGLAFANYSTGTDNNGAFATGVVVRRANGRGISVLGTSDVLIESFHVEDTVGQGILASHDPNAVRRARNVHFVNGRVKNGGRYAGDNPSNKYGAEFFNTEGTSEMSGVVIDTPNVRGLNVAAATGEVLLRDVYVRGAAGPGYQVVAQSFIIEDCAAEDCDSYGYVFLNSGRVRYRNIYARNVAKTQTAGARRALYMDNLAGSSFAEMVADGDGLYIYDDQAAPTSYKLYTGADSATGKTLAGTLGNIRWHTAVVLPDTPLIGTVTLPMSRSYAGAQSSEGTAPPATGHWRAGDVRRNTAPAVGSPPRWVCVTSGTPGTWASEANLA